MANKLSSARCLGRATGRANHVLTPSEDRREGFVFLVHHMVRPFCLKGEEAWPSVEWIVKRLVKVGTKAACHDRRRPVQFMRLRPSLWPGPKRRGHVLNLLENEEGCILAVGKTPMRFGEAYSAEDAHLIRAKTPSCSRARRPLHRSEATLVF